MSGQGEVGLRMGATRTRRPPNDVVLILRVPRALREVAATEASRQGISLSEAVRVALEAWLGTHGIRRG